MSYTEKAKKIRSGLSQYSKTSFLYQLLEFLHSPEEDTNSLAKKMPWLSFLLIEWLYQVDEAKKPRHASKEDVWKILNKMYKLQNDAVRLGESANKELALRKMLIGQLWVQRSSIIHWHSLMRIYSILSNGKEAPYFSKEFKKITDLDIDDFFQLSLWVLVRFPAGANRTPLQRAIIELTPSYSIDTISKFFKLTGIAITNLGSFLKPYGNSSVTIDSYFAESVLISKPLLYLGSEIVTPHRILLSKALSDYPLNIFKHSDYEKFKNKFTKEFERYTEITLKESDVDYISESDIMAIYNADGVSGKVVDFLVSDTASSVFIDAKGIEPHRKIKVSDNPEVLKDKLSKSFIHGVKQAHECANLLSNSSRIRIADFHNRYALIVTHQDFYVLNGRKIKDSISPDLFDRLEEKLNGKLIPIENIYFTCIEDFEGLVKVCKDARATIADFLRFCAEQDSAPETRKFDIRQHIESFSHAHQLSNNSPIGTDRIIKQADYAFKNLTRTINKNIQFWQLGGVSRLPRYINCHRSLCSNLEVAKFVI